MNKTYMLDICICSFIIREQPEVILKRLERAIPHNHRIVVSVVAYSEMRFGVIGPKASPRHVQLVDELCARLGVTLPWDRAAVDIITKVKVVPRLTGMSIGPGNTVIIGHTIAAGAILVMSNIREFERMLDLVLEDWVK